MAKDESEYDPFMPDGGRKVETSLGPAWPKPDDNGNIVVGSFCEGKIKGRKESEFGNNYILSDAVTGIIDKDGKKTSSTVTDSEGAQSDLLVWGSGFLNPLMADMAIGERVRIVFTGFSQPKKRGHSPGKQFVVYVI